MTPEQQARRLFDEIQIDDEVYSCRIIAAALTAKDDEIERIKTVEFPLRVENVTKTLKAERDQLRERVADLERCLKICGGELKDDGNLLVRTDKFNKALAAAKIEGLREAAYMLEGGGFHGEMEKTIQVYRKLILDKAAEIAKLENGQ